MKLLDVTTDDLRGVMKEQADQLEKDRKTLERATETDIEEKPNLLSSKLFRTGIGSRRNKD